MIEFKQDDEIMMVTVLSPWKKMPMPFPEPMRILPLQSRVRSEAFIMRTPLEFESAIEYGLAEMLIMMSVFM